MTRTILRTIAWTLLVTAVVLTVVPGQFRPVTGAPSWLEHFAMFSILGAAFALSYPNRSSLLYSFSIVFTASLELLQLYLPSRHARWSDFLIDASAALFGILCGSLAECVKLHKSAGAS